MSAKNPKQIYIPTGRELIASTGCLLIILPILAKMVVILGGFALWVLKLYFFGTTAGDVTAFQDSAYLLIFVIIMLTLFMVLRATWHTFIEFYGAFVRYYRMRVEASRIERQIKRMPESISEDDVLYSHYDDLPEEMKR